MRLDWERLNEILDAILYQMEKDREEEGINRE